MMLFASVCVNCILYIYLNPVASPFYLVVEVLTSGGADVVVWIVTEKTEAKKLFARQSEKIKKNIHTTTKINIVYFFDVIVGIFQTLQLWKYKVYNTLQSLKHTHNFVNY